MEQEGLRVLRQTRQHLFKKIGLNMPIVSRAGGAKMSKICVALQGAARQVQTRDPALDALIQLIQFLRPGFHVQHTGKQFLHFLTSQAQRVGTQFRKLSRGPQANKQARRFATAGKNQMDVRGQMSKEELERMMNALTLDHVIVIKNQYLTFRLNRVGIAMKPL